MFQPHTAFRRDQLAARLLALVTLALVASCGACGGGSSVPAPPVDLPAFDSTSAFADLTAQCAFGPRDPGSKGHDAQLAWMKTTLHPLAARVVLQPYTLSTPYGGPYDFENVLAAFSEGQPGPITMLCAHWDTRPVADEDLLPANQHTPILGANDGASGVAILLQLARIFHAQAPPHPVYLVFLDAEDSGKLGAPGIYEGFCLGTAYLAQNWPAGLPRPTRGILLDLVGGVAKHDARLGNPRGSVDHLDLPMEGNSLQYAPTLVDEVWTRAAQVGATAFRRASGQSIIDDHMPFNQASPPIPTIDLIQTPFPAVWHTVDDTPEYCSASALAQVGKTLVAVIYGS